MLVILGSHQIRSQSFGLQGQSTEHLEAAEHHGRSHRRWRDPRIPSVDSDTGLVTELAGHHNRLAGQGTGLETAG
jgi:hypothetical protein